MKQLLWSIVKIRNYFSNHSLLFLRFYKLVIHKPSLYNKHPVAIILYRLPLIICLVILLPIWILDIAFSKNKLFVHEIGIHITSKCTLCCRNCISLMQYYDSNHAFMTDIEQLKKDINNLLDMVDYIGNISIQGGEPLLHPSLEKIIGIFLVSKKVGSIAIITNGTIVPKDELLQLISENNERVSLTISKYPRKLTPKIDHILDKVKSYNINPYHMNVEWQDQYTRGLQSRGYNTEELKRIYKKCSTPCHSFVEGRLYACYVSAHGSRLGIVPCPEQDYADIRNPNELTRKNLKKIFSLAKGYYIQACNYCDVTYEDRIEVPVAVQVPLDERPLKPY